MLDKINDFEIDKGHDIPVFSEVCMFCKNLIEDGIDRGCQAFPKKEGIPMEIWMGKNKHTEPLPNQGNTVVFERIERA